jgi:hypothetical protein
MSATIVFSFLAFLVAVFSLAVSTERFRLDLYNKRFDIYARTVKFYQALMGKESDPSIEFTVRQTDFILACREAKFMFEPKSGVYDLLNRLNDASFKLIGFKHLPEGGLRPEDRINFYNQRAEALMLWNTQIEPLEDLMAPYLNYHYASLPSALVAWMRRRLASALTD